VFLFVISCLPPVAVLAPNGVVVLGLVGAIGFALSPRVLSRLRGSLTSPLAMVLAAFLIWAAVASLWSPNPPRSLFLVVRLALIFAGGLIYLSAFRELDGAGRERAVTALAWSGPVFLALLGSEVVTDGTLIKLVRGIPLDERFNFTYLARPSVLLAIFAWPSALALWRRVHGVAAGLFLILALAYLVQGPILAALVAFVLGGCAFLATLFKPRPVMIALLAVAITGVVLAPGLLTPRLIHGLDTSEVVEMAQDLPPGAASVKHRIIIADFVLERIAERPLLGWGFDASRAMPGGRALAYRGAFLLPLHPHNAALQVWLELGLPGALIAAAVLALVFRGLLAFAPCPRAAATGAATFTVYFLIALMSFGIWQNWWMTTAWLMAILAALPMTQEQADAAAAAR
jgi:O-antigen ligase